MTGIKLLLISFGVMIVLIVGSILVTAGDQDTGFDFVLDSYGYDLIDYEITSKYKFDEEQFTALNITCEKDGEIYNFNWIMKKERYNELKEKV